MKFLKKTALAAMCLVLVLGCAACGGVSADDAVAYAQGELDAAYLGIYSQEFLDLVDITEDDARETHEQNISAETDYFLGTYIGVSDVEALPDDVRQSVEDMYEEIYSHSKYTVNSATQTSEGDYNVDVTIYPIDIMQRFTAEELQAIWDEVTTELSAGIDVASLSDEEYVELYNSCDAEYVRRTVELIEGLIPELDYEEAQSAVLKLELEDNVYTAVETDWANIDLMIIDYSGAYAG